MDSIFYIVGFPLRAFVAAFFIVLLLGLSLLSPGSAKWERETDSLALWVWTVCQPEGVFQ